MSARKIRSTDMLTAAASAPRVTRLDLPAHAVKISKNGIEFQSRHYIPSWTEMTVALETPTDSRKVNFTGVVVQCEGNRQTGYRVLMVFTNLSRQAQSRLSALAQSRLA